MNKKILIPIIVVISIIVIIFAIIVLAPKNHNQESESNNYLETNTAMQNDEISSNTVKNDDKEQDMDLIYIKINNQILNVELEENSATQNLKEELKNKDITIEAHEYGGFEKVGDLGFSLPREDTNIKTSPGDIVLYQGNQISLFYNSNSWSYTRLGKIKDINSEELKKILGNGDVTITFSISR